MITVTLTDAECARLGDFYETEAGKIAMSLADAKPETFATLAKDLADLAKLAGKLEAARSLARSGATNVVPMSQEPPTDNVGGQVLDAGVPKRK